MCKYTVLFYYFVFAEFLFVHECCVNMYSNLSIFLRDLPWFYSHLGETIYSLQHSNLRLRHTISMRRTILARWIESFVCSTDQPQVAFVLKCNLFFQRILNMLSSSAFYLLCLHFVVSLTKSCSIIRFKFPWNRIGRTLL